MKSYGKYLLLLYTVLNLNLFSYTKLIYNNQFINFIKLINFIPVIIYFLHVILTRKKRNGFFSFPVLIFILSLISGAISAYLYYNQTLIQSFTITSIFFPFITYLLLVQLNFNREQVIYVVMITFWMTLLIFSIDYFTFPNTSFASQSDEEETRNAFKIIFQGQGFTILGSLIYLHNYLTSKKLYNIIPFVLASGFIIFLTGSRTYFFALIISSIFVIIYYLVFIRTNNSKIFLILPLLVVLYISAYYLQSFIINLVDITTNQISDMSNDIRVECMKYYSTTFQKGIFTQLFGNGLPHSESELGILAAKAQASGYYVSDIGIVGLWSYFGIFSVIAWIIIFKKIFTIKFISQNLVVVSFFIYIFINSFIVYTLFDPGYILAYIYALYLYVPKTDKTKTAKITRLFP